ncbi:hypothetical protein GCM10029964_028600 [Kibdelosporangium lantanae]
MPIELAALTAIAALLAPGNQDVAGRVAHAHTDPEAYVRDHAERLDERGIDEPTENLAWIALIDALADDFLVAEVDWKEDPDDVVAELRSLNSSPDDGWDWVTDADDNLPTYEFLELAGTHLYAAETALAVLDIESDCYPLVLLPVDKAKELVTLAETAGFTAAVIPSSGPGV